MIQVGQLSWAPTEKLDGVTLFFNDKPFVELTYAAARELSLDMNEAALDQRDLRPIDLFASEIYDGDFIVVLGNLYKVTNTLVQANNIWIIQYALNEYHDGEGETEVTLPGDLQVTVWRPRP